MKSLYLTYSKFTCQINYEQKYEQSVSSLVDCFSDYYSFDIANDNNEIEINLIKGLVPLKDFTNRENIILHSSHSKNRKYFLNGNIWNQEDAIINAEMRCKPGVIQYIIEDRNTIIQIEKKKISICGENIYDDLLYSIETSLCTFYEHEIGGIALHAACCVKNGEAIIICAQSGAGKTTLLFDLIKSKGAQFHANDRIILYEDNGQLFVLSLPIPVNIPIKIMRKYSILDNNKTVKNAEDESKIRFNVNQISLITNNIIFTDVIAKILLLPYYNPLSENSVKKLSALKTIEELDILTNNDVCHPNWLKIYTEEISKDEIQKKLEKWLKNMNCYKVIGSNLLKSLEDSEI